MANWFLDLFTRRKRNVAASAKLTARSSALMRPRSRMRGLSRMPSVAAIAALSSGPASIGRQFSTGFSGAFCVALAPAVARQFADEFTDGFA